MLIKLQLDNKFFFYIYTIFALVQFKIHKRVKPKE